MFSLSTRYIVFCYCFSSYCFAIIGLDFLEAALTSPINFFIYKSDFTRVIYKCKITCSFFIELAPGRHLGVA